MNDLHLELSDDDVRRQLARLLAERDIHNALNSYAQGVDRRDWDQVRSVYHDDALDDHGHLGGNPDVFVDQLRKRHAHVLSSLHLTSNVSIRLDAEGRTARVESYCISFQQVDPAAAHSDPYADPESKSTRTTIGCRYVDDFEYRQGIGWRIARRMLVAEWMRREVDGDYLPADPAVLHGHRDGSDALYAPWTPTHPRVDVRPEETP
jgi:hypothetical protein